jgi:anti-sigma regulatory factor (Ser/Thr protein kinase)
MLPGASEERSQPWQGAMTDSPNYYVALDSQNPAAQARRLVTQACDSWPTTRIEDAQLLVTELVANAVLHGQGDVLVRIAARPDLLHVSVADDHPGTPVMANPSLRDEHGRGLRIIDALAHSWGTALGPNPNGKAVWFALHRDGH